MLGKKPTASPAQLESGLIQRVTALNRFLDDLYVGEQAAINDGIIPRWLVTSSDGFERESVNVPVPNGAEVRPEGSEIYVTKNNRLLIIDHSEQPKSDPVADWKQQEKERSGSKYRNYKSLGVRPVTARIYRLANVLRMIRCSGQFTTLTPFR